MNIAINGFGRIGRTFLRRVLQDPKARQSLNIVAINIGPGHIEHVPHLFKYDTIMGTYPDKVSLSGSSLMIDDVVVPLIAECDPKKLPWKKFKVDWVAECSGCFTKREDANDHLEAGAKNVLISAPASGEDITIIPGINDNAYDNNAHHIISLGSCTTNAFAPMVKVCLERLGLTEGLMTTIHAYTNNQVVLDSIHHDLRRARAASCNIIPTSTGAEKVILKLFPQLKGKIHAKAIRVPVPIGSLIDFTFSSDEKLSTDKINSAFKEASEKELSPYLAYTDEQLVSSDYAGNIASCIFDSCLTIATPHLGKVFGWYDNEVGYSERMKDFFLHNC